MKFSLRGARLLGPVFFHDLVSLARRRRYFVLRTLVPALLLYLLWVTFRDVTRSDRGVPRQALTEQAGIFFSAFMSAQFLLAILVTPAYTASAIAEDKDWRRMDFLFATDLENQEIVFGKLLARLANLLCLLLAGLPVLSFVQFWGGVDPDLVLVGFAALALTVVSIASFSIYQSVRARRSRDAIVSTYLFLFAYFGLSSLAIPLLGFKGLTTYSILSWPRLITGGTLIKAFGAGNILFAREELAEAVRGGKPLISVIPTVFVRYAAFHILVAITFVAAAVAQVRRLGLTESLPKPRRRAQPCEC